MTKSTRKSRQEALGKVLERLGTIHNPVNNGTLSLYELNFGAGYDFSCQLWSIYNGITDNCIATVKFVEDDVVLRYRPASFYKDVLVNWDKVTMAAPADLANRRGFCRSYLRKVVIENLRQAGLKTETVTFRGYTIDSRILDKYSPDLIDSFITALERNHVSTKTISSRINDHAALAQYAHEVAARQRRTFSSSSPFTIFNAGMAGVGRRMSPREIVETYSQITRQRTESPIRGTQVVVEQELQRLYESERANVQQYLEELELDARGNTGEHPGRVE